MDGYGEMLLLFIVMDGVGSGDGGNGNYSNFARGVRPLICLNSNILLSDKNQDGVLEFEQVR